MHETQRHKFDKVRKEMRYSTKACHHCKTPFLDGKSLLNHLASCQKTGSSPKRARKLDTTTSETTTFQPMDMSLEQEIAVEGLKYDMKELIEVRSK